MLMQPLFHIPLLRVLSSERNYRFHTFHGFARNDGGYLSRGALSNHRSKPVIHPSNSTINTRVRRINSNAPITQPHQNLLLWISQSNRLESSKYNRIYISLAG